MAALLKASPSFVQPGLFQVNTEIPGSSARLLSPWPAKLPGASRSRLCGTSLPLQAVGAERGGRGLSQRAGGALQTQAVSEGAAATTAAVYGALMLAGGFFAYKKSGSKGSLTGGATAAATSAATYFLLQNPETTSTGLSVGFGTGLLFAIFFGIRWAATKKAIPAAPLLGLSAITSLIFLSAYLD